LVGQPHLEHNYKTCMSKSSISNNHQCFQILGFDILLDNDLKPWLLEVNQTPSFNDDTPVDKQVKGALIEDTLRLINVRKESRNYNSKSVAHRNRINQLSGAEII